jgi:hypothetical protein
VLGEPTRRLGFRDNRKDFDGFKRDVIEHSWLPNPEPVLRPAQTAQALDAALAHAGRLVSQVPFEGVSHLAAPVAV